MTNPQLSTEQIWQYQQWSHIPKVRRLLISFCEFRGVSVGHQHIIQRGYQATLILQIQSKSNHYHYTYVWPMFKIYLHFLKNLSMPTIKRPNQVPILVSAIITMLVVNISFSIAEESLYQQFPNSQTSAMENLNSTLFIVFTTSLIKFSLATLYNRTHGLEPVIKGKQLYVYGSLSLLILLMIAESIKQTNYLIVLVGRSSRPLIVVIVALLFTGVKDQKKHLSQVQIVSGILITVGVLVFFLYDPVMTNQQSNNSLYGIILLFVCLFMQGFMTDLRARIIELYKPQPSQFTAQMMQFIAFTSFALLIFKSQLIQSIKFVYYHPALAPRLIGFGIISFLSEMIVFYLASNFKQHIVPYVGSFRKILATIFSIYLYNHHVKQAQIVGLTIVSLVTLGEVFYQLNIKQAQAKIQLKSIKSQ